MPRAPWELPTACQIAYARMPSRKEIFSRISVPLPDAPSANQPNQPIAIHPTCSVYAFQPLFAGTRELRPSTDPFQFFHHERVLPNGRGLSWWVSATGVWCPIFPVLLCSPSSSSYGVSRKNGPFGCLRGMGILQHVICESRVISSPLYSLEGTTAWSATRT